MWIRERWSICRGLITCMNFFRGHVGPLHKIQGYQGHRNVSKCRPHSGDICTTRGNHLKTSFSYIVQNVNKNIFWAIWEARRESSMIGLGLFFFFHIWGLLGGPYVKRKFQGSKTSSQSRHMYNNGKKYPMLPVFHIWATT